jgi:hypothetical protein
MLALSPFYSVKEKFKLAAERIYHNNDACTLAQSVPHNARLPGTGGHKLCQECERLNKTAR